MRKRSTGAEFYGRREVRSQTRNVGPSGRVARLRRSPGHCDSRDTGEIHPNTAEPPIVAAKYLDLHRPGLTEAELEQKRSSGREIRAHGLQEVANLREAVLTR